MCACWLLSVLLTRGNAHFSSQQGGLERVRRRWLIPNSLGWSKRKPPKISIHGIPSLRQDQLCFGPSSRVQNVSL